MNDQDEQQVTPVKSGMSIGWVVAVLLVAVAWAGAYALRGSGEKEVVEGWADGMAAGQILAQETDKPMVVFFTAGWCPPCKVIKKNVLAKSEVNDALQAGFVPVQIDLTDQSSSNPNMATAQTYSVRGIPTIIAMTPQGEPIDVYAGEPQPTAFIGWLDQLSQ